MLHETFPPPASVADPEPWLTLRGMASALRCRWRAVALVGAVTAVSYALIAGSVYLLAPAERVVTLPFRLDFEGASEGRFPNGMRFAIDDVVTEPVLAEVFVANRLDRFTTAEEWSRSVVVLETNLRLDALVSELQARLADPRLTAIDRERIEREFQLRRAALRKNEFTLNHLSDARGAAIPETVVRKALGDVLGAWARRSVERQHALSYQVATFSPGNLDAAPGGDDELRSLLVLRDQATRALASLEEVADLPGATLARTPAGDSVADVRYRVESLLRFQLEPRARAAAAALAGPARQAAVELVRSQVAFDRRRLEAARAHAATVRESLAVYDAERRPPAAPAPGDAAPGASAPDVVPQLSESFLDRLMALQQSAADREYRQRMTRDYELAARRAVAPGMAVAFGEELLALLAGAGGGVGAAREPGADPSALRAEARALVGTIGELYRLTSTNLEPATQLLTRTAPPSTRVQRAVGLPRLAALGGLVVLASLGLAAAGVVLAERLRPREASA